MRHAKGTIVRAVTPLYNARSLESPDQLGPNPQVQGVIGLVIDTIGHSFARVINESDGWVVNAETEKLARVGFIAVRGGRATIQIDGQEPVLVETGKSGAADVRAAAFMIYLVQRAAESDPICWNCGQRQSEHLSRNGDCDLSVRNRR